MNATELLKRIIASGADEVGIRDRFGDDLDLYESCLSEFMQEPSFAALRDAIQSQNYEQAFKEAHALKGLAGNLGITGFYNAIRTLTNSLRNAVYDRVDEEYAEVDRQYEILKCLITEETMPTQQAAPQDPPQAERKHMRPWNFPSPIKDKNNRIFVYLLVAIVAIYVLVILMFGRINSMHRQNVTSESSIHLVEIGKQVTQFIEDSVDIDWKIANSVGNSIINSAFVDDDAAVFNMLQIEQISWGVSDLMLYTENGYCIYADGSTEMTDIASTTVFRARKNGKDLSIIDSRLIFTVPMDTRLTYRGGEIVAISVVRDISSFLDEMDFSSFGGEAWMYITDENGIVLSSLTNPSTIKAFNMQAIVKDMAIQPLDNVNTTEDFISTSEISVFMISDGTDKLYGISAPIFTEAKPLRLFYFVPEIVVNSVMSGFSKQLLTISLGVILLLSMVTFTAFTIIYKNRKKDFDQAIQTREKMFDLLIKNTRTAFGLYSANLAQPVYQSANTETVIGEAFWALDKTDTGFHIHNAEHSETENITLVNEELRKWDGKSTFHSGYLCNRKDATPTYFVFELYPVDTETNDFVGIAQDFTPVHDREEEVKRAMESANQANAAKSNFLSSMSHDIRTPMNAIINMSSFALESLDRPKQLGNYLHTIHESAGHLLELVNDVLDMSRIESGQLVVGSAPFELREEMQRQAEMIRPLCNAKNQTLITDFSRLRETRVCGDALKLSQIVTNLLSNATKYTPERGAVRFIAEEIPSLREDFMTLRFTVEDNGIGITEADIKHIFESFSRSGDKAISKIEGTGLGLAIAKNYVDAMGGTIHCESEYGEGSTFSVELSFQRDDLSIDHAVPAVTLTDASFLGMHALVAEDNHTNQIIAKEILERMGFILDFVEDGREAVQKFCESKPYTYDVIYMDIHMPVMDGLTAATEIRASNHPQAKTIPIIAMTANAFAEDIEKTRAVGMDGHVAKPIISFDLAKQTKNAIENKRGETK